MTNNQDRPRYVQCLSFIKAYIDINGISPSHSEIMDHFGWKTKSNVVRILDVLEERNLIVRTPQKSRSIRLVKPKIETEFLWTNYDLDDIILQFLAENDINVVDVASPQNPLQSVTINFKAIQPRCKVTFEREVTGE